MQWMPALRSIVPLLVLWALTTAPAYGSGVSTVNALVIDPQTPTTMYAGMCDGRGVLKSVDGGDTWNASGLTGAAVFFLAIDPRTPSTLYAAAGGWDCPGNLIVGGPEGGVYKTTDGGVTWTIVGLTGHNVSAVAIDPQNPDVVYAAGEWIGVLKSTDGGRTWNYTGAGPLITHSLAIAPSDPGTIYAGDEYIGDEGFTWYGGVFKSLDGGQTWTITGIGGGFIDSVAVDPRVPTTVYAGGIWSIDYRTGAKGIFKSTDGGQTWTSGDWEPCCSVVIDPQRSTMLYSGSSSGLYKSTDGAANWVLNTALRDLLARYGTSPEVGTIVIQPAGSTAATNQEPSMFVVTAIGVLKSMDGGASWTSTGLSQHSLLASLTLNPTNVVSGTSSSGTVTLAAVAAADVTVSLTSSDPLVASVPPTVTVPAGATGATFIVTTYPTSAYAWPTICAALDDAARSALLVVIPSTSLSTLTLNPGDVIGGAFSVATVTLSSPSTGALIQIVSSDPAIAAVPATLTVPPGAASATFTISTTSVGVSTTVTISATLNGVTKSTVLTVNPPPSALASVTVVPPVLTGGASSIGTVTLSGPAPAGGAAVSLSSSNTAAATVPASAVVAAGATTATFAISTSAVAAPTAVTISATYGGVTASTVLTVNGPALASVTVAAAIVIGGASSSGTVTLSGPAPAGGALVALSTSNVAAAMVPSNVIVAPGATSASFTVATIGSCAAATATIAASYSGVTKSSVLTVNPGPMDTVTIDRADYFQHKQLLQVTARGSIFTATLQVFVTGSAALIGTLTNDGSGRYSGAFNIQTNPQSITVRSSSCGSATRIVALK